MFKMSILFLVSFFLFGVIGPVTAEEKKPAGNSWIVDCTNRGGKGLKCVITHTVIHKKTRQSVIVARVYKNTSQSLPTLNLRLPHGVSLPKGVRLSFDKDKAQKLIISHADASGSYAEMELGGSLMSKMRTSKKMNVEMTGRNGKAISLALDLQGFADSSKHLK